MNPEFWTTIDARFRRIRTRLLLIVLLGVPPFTAFVGLGLLAGAGFDPEFADRTASAWVGAALLLAGVIVTAIVFYVRRLMRRL